MFPIILFALINYTSLPLCPYTLTSYKELPCEFENGTVAFNQLFFNRTSVEGFPIKAYEWIPFISYLKSE